MNVKTILLSIICGVAVALLSAVYSTDMTAGRIGALITGYGLPLPWLKSVTPVVFEPTTTYSLYESGLSLLADIAFWTVIVAVIYVVYKQVKK